jgi:hypothetical protein
MTFKDKGIVGLLTKLDFENLKKMDRKHQEVAKYERP